MYFLLCLENPLFLQILCSILRVEQHVLGLHLSASDCFFSDVLAIDITNQYTDNKEYNADDNSHY